MKNKVDAISEFLKVIGDASRLKVLIFIRNKPQCVCKIFPMLGISQKLASHHLAQLRKLDLVRQERDGNFIYYSINKKVIKKYKKLLNKFI